MNNSCFLIMALVYFFIEMKNKHNKYFLTAIAFLFLSGSYVFAWDGLNNFDAYVQNGKIVVEWQTKHEDNVDHFVVQRSMNSTNSFYDLATIDPHGNGWSYIFIDEKVLGKSVNMVYNYRLKIVFRDKSVAYSNNTVQVVMVVSSLQHTWGSIKAMFQ